MKSYIAVIDSGIGGISILNQLIKKFKAGNYIYFADNKYMPYGNKSKEFVKNRVEEIITYLKQNYIIDKIIIACNTASSCLNFHDKDILTLKFNKTDSYLTTPLTKANLTGFKVISAPNLASIIENNIHNKFKLNKLVKQTVKELNLDKLQSLTLGCTHYELVEKIFKKYCKNTVIKLNSTGVISKIQQPNEKGLNLILILSNNTKQYKNKILKLIS